MISSYELRVGNYVLVDKQLQQVSMIDERSSVTAMTSVDKMKISSNCTLDNIRPVVLTDDILKQCGFVYHDYFKFWQLVLGHEENRSEMDIDGDYNILDFMRKPVVKKVSSLHQLQNIYYMLKGKELAFVES